MSFVTDTVNMEKAEVIANYDAINPNELTVRVGESVEIIDKEMDSNGWWKVRIINMHMIWYRVINRIAALSNSSTILLRYELLD